MTTTHAAAPKTALVPAREGAPAAQPQAAPTVQGNNTGAGVSAVHEELPSTSVYHPSRVVSVGPDGKLLRPKVVIVGGGFGGREVEKNLRRAGLDVTVIDKNDYTTFQA